MKVSIDKSVFELFFVLELIYPVIIQSVFLL